MRRLPAPRHAPPRRRIRYALALAVLGCVACDEYLGCTPVLTSEEGQLQFEESQIVVGACGRLRGPGPLLVGSRWCPLIGCHPEVPGCEEDQVRLPSASVVECFEQRVEGPVARDGDCIVIEGAGTFTWHFDPVACPANDVGFVPIPDRLRLPSVAVEDVIGHFDSPGDAWARRNLHPGPFESFPEDAQLGPGIVAYVLGDTSVSLALVLAHPDHAEPVGWQPVDWTPVVEGDDGTPIDHAFSPDGLLTLTLSAGQVATVALERDGDRIEVGTIEGVDAASVASLEIVVGYRRTDDGGFDVPIGARAVARRADGAVVWGVPVQWEVTAGAFPLWRDETPEWGPEYVALMDEEGRGCHPPPKNSRTYEAALAVRWNDLEDEIELTWRERAPDRGVLETIADWFTDDDHENSPLCQGPGFPAEDGCACRSGHGGGPVRALGFFGIALWLRRHPRSSGAIRSTTATSSTVRPRP